MAADLIHDETSGRTEREPWQAPRVTRFGAAGASAGDQVFNSADGDSLKS